MDVGHVDQPIILIVAGIDRRLADRFVRNITPLPGGHLGVDRLRIGARPKLHVHITGLPAIFGQEGRRIAEISRGIEPDEDVESHVRIARQILDDAGDPVVDGGAAYIERQCLPDRIAFAEDPVGFRT